MTAGVAVVIVNYNTRDHLRYCLETVIPERPADVVVVDNASTDGSQDMVGELFASVRLFANLENPGYGAAANQGVRATSAPYVLLLNSDTRIEAGALVALSGYLDEHPKAAIAGPALVFPDLRHQPSCFPPLTPFNTLVLNTYLLDVARVTPGLRARFRGVWEPVPEGPVEWIKGAALALRRRAFDAVSGFDEEYFMYSEEVDLCYRLSRAGWETHFTPRTRVVHVEGASTSTRREEMSAKLFDSLDHFYRKHWSAGRRFRLRIVVVIVMLQRILRDGVSYLRNHDPERRVRIRDDRRVWMQILRRQFS